MKHPEKSIMRPMIGDTIVDANEVVGERAETKCPNDTET